MKFTNLFIAALMLVGISATLSAAEDDTSWWDEPWRFSAKGYAWLPDAPVRIKIDQQEVANLPESFDSILDSLEVAAMFELEAHKGRLGFFVSPIYYEGKDSEHFAGPLGQRRKVTLKEKVWLIDYGVSYDVATFKLGKGASSPTVTLSPYVGATYFHDPIKVDVAPGLLDIGLNINKTIEFNTPIIGGSTKWHFSDRWSVRAGGHQGVFDASEINSIRQYFGIAEYHFKIKEVASQIFAGYRYTHIDYEDNPLELHVDVKGPLVGVGVEF